MGLALLEEFNTDTEAYTYLELMKQEFNEGRLFVYFEDGKYGVWLD